MRTFCLIVYISSIIINLASEFLCVIYALVCATSWFKISFRAKTKTCFILGGASLVNWGSLIWTVSIKTFAVTYCSCILILYPLLRKSKLYFPVIDLHWLLLNDERFIVNWYSTFFQQWGAIFVLRARLRNNPTFNQVT